MGKKIALLLAAIGLVFQISACTSSDNKGDSQTAQDSESVDGANTEAAAQSANSENLTSDVISEDQLSADPNAPAAENTSNKEMTSSTTTTETRDENTSSTSSATVENTTTANQTQTAPAVNNTVTEVAPPAPEASQAVVVPPTDSATDHASAAPKASLQKMQSTPWQVGDTWVNAVYFARPGETLSKISKKIYGANKVSMLKKINPSLSGGVRPGDKVYYNSPVRPDDSLRLLTFFEDNGVAPEMYSAAEGDNLRKVSKKLLGYDNAWKEVWSTNLVESKTSLTAGTELRYWKGEATPVTAPPPPAMADMPAPTKSSEQASGQPGATKGGPSAEELAMAANAGQVPPMPAPAHDMAGPNGPNAGGAAAAPPPADMPAPPPPPMEPPPPVPSMAGNELAPPPPPIDANLGGEKKEKKKKAAHAEDDMMSQDNMMAMIAVGAALAGLLALVIVRRKRKQKEAEAAFSDTHVG